MLIHTIQEQIQFITQHAIPKLQQWRGVFIEADRILSVMDNDKLTRKRKLHDVADSMDKNSNVEDEMLSTRMGMTSVTALMKDIDHILRFKCKDFVKE